MLLLCALILNMFTAFASNSMIYIYVSPIGDDKNDGKVGNPFKTINKALKYIDTLPGTEDITIYLYSGVYRERVIIDKSYGRKVNFKNIQGETPIIDGSQLLGGFTQYNGNIYKINVSGISGTSVFDNGAPMTLARYPNSGYLAGDASSPISYNEFCYKSGEMPNLSNSLNLKVSLWPSGPNGVWNYFNTEHTITNIDLLTRKITISPDAVYQLGTGTRYYLINSLELLDSPGEWYLDSSTKDLYCYPSSGSFENISISGNNPLITIEGSNNITFDGITLQGGGYNAVYLMNSNNISILNCHIRNVDGNAIYMAPQGNNNTFYGNKIENIGFCGIQLQGQNKHYTNPSIKGNIIKNNEISKVGTKIGHGVAISIINSAENIISHNKIFDIPRHGIAFGGSSPETLINQSPIDGQIVTTENVRDYYTTRDNIIEYNDISDVIKDSQDAGAINGWMTGSNNVIRQNRVYNVNIPFSFGFGGIYLDAGTDDTLVEKNIIYDLQKKWHKHKRNGKCRIN